MRRQLIRWTLFLVALLLQACIYLPRQTEVYDAGCQIVARQLVLQEVQIASLGGCANQGCLVLLAAAGATAAASAIISGSLVLVGNVAYWLERQGQCRRVQ